MSLALHLVALLGLCAAAIALSRAALSSGGAKGLGAILAAVAVITFEAARALGLGMMQALCMALIAAALAGIVWTDVRNRRIPNLYLAVILLSALAGARAMTLTEAALGAAACGGGAAVAAWGARRFGVVQGVGLGAIKLAAVLGAFYGLGGGLHMLAVAAAASLVILIWRGKFRSIRPAWAPFGATLALSGGVFLAWSMVR